MSLLNDFVRDVVAAKKKKAKGPLTIRRAPATAAAQRILDELKAAAEALKHADPESLAIVTEVKRGTASYYITETR